MPVARSHLGSTAPISDVCLVPEDLERSLDFYQNTLGFVLQHRMPGFADFEAPGAVPGVRLALWEREHLAATTGASPAPRGAGHAVIVAVNLERPEQIDELHADLVAAGVEFIKPPADYPWNARCVYFTGPDNELWELYAWLDGIEPGKV
ncbi:VOC family protein [Herbiconiux daphne]|uniref:VOC family protein n=1 Tax=Herbiconiux daphne TaxID=2970914 RepID=A0ABT2H369_9MICO|nr:VOC family protein [Herbiconiux daphne]MCS5734370.1 VOC family protein [Herbiconiux daphne]